MDSKGKKRNFACSQNNDDMKLKRLYFKNKLTGWRVKEVDFDNLTLLVGASGVGKTQILQALSSLAKIARGDSANGAEWELVFGLDGKEYTWAGEFEAVKSDAEIVYNFKHPKYNMLQESLTVDSKQIVSRHAEQLVYNDAPTVKLDTSKSVIDLLKAEDLIAPVAKGFHRLYQLQGNDIGITISPVTSDTETPLGLNAIKEKAFLSPFDKLFLLKKNNLQEFGFVKQQFMEIFPLVEDVDFAITTFFNELPLPVLKIKERNVDSWILQPNISAGMRKTLAQIVTLALADDGDVILIDEFENGLGVNCINQLAELILDPEADVQVIMTSHHPYIINTIPFNKWKVVTRRASDVSVHTAAELNIGNHSRHEAFMQLIQTSAYKTGIL